MHGFASTQILTGAGAGAPVGWLETKWVYSLESGIYMNNLAGTQKLSEKGKITADRAELPISIAAGGGPAFVRDELQTGESSDAVRIRLRLSLSVANSQVGVEPELGEPGVEESVAHGGKGCISRWI